MTIFVFGSIKSKFELYYHFCHLFSHFSLNLNEISPQDTLGRFLKYQQIILNQQTFLFIFLFTIALPYLESKRTFRSGQNQFQAQFWIPLDPEKKLEWVPGGSYFIHNKKIFKLGLENLNLKNSHLEWSNQKAAKQ